MDKVRYPAVAGSFYESSKEDLIKRLEWCFLHRLGPGKLPTKKAEVEERVLGIVSPHAGYMYSGPVAAHGFYELSRRKKPDLFIILGPNHYQAGALLAVSSADVWSTPLGYVRVDQDAAKKLVQISKLLEYDDTAHLYEHSIEVQLPFLQYIYGEDFKIVPISMILQEPNACIELGKAIFEFAKENNLNITVIASTDFTHYEPHEVASRKDKLAIDAILKLNPKLLYDTVIEHDITMCGCGPVMTLLSYLNNFSNVEARLLKYATSGDITGDYSSVVGYASIIFLLK